MKQKLKTVYTISDPKSSCLIVRTDDDFFKNHVKKQRLITFTLEEYNQHIEDVIKDALETANKKALIDRKPTGDGDDSDEETSKSFVGDLGYEEYIPVEYIVNKESITNTFDDTFNKYKL